jgi:hypothetical protein
MLDVKGMDALDLDRAALLLMYRNMLLMRGIEERGHILYKQGRIPGSFYTGRGNEAASIGVATAMRPDDVGTPLHRLAEGSRLRLDVPEQKREELFFLIAKVDTLFVPEELHEFAGRREPSRSISVRGSTAQPQCLHESIVMVARERDQGGWRFIPPL